MLAQQPSADPPPPYLSPNLYKAAVVETVGDAIASVSASLSDRSVTLSWAYTSAGPSPNRADTQEIAVAFWPTEIATLGGRRLAVAGKARAITMIEVWTFAESPLPLPYIDPTTGEWVYVKYAPSIESKEVLYAESTSGRDVVATLFADAAPVAGASASVYAQFLDSREFYRIDDAGLLQKIASPSDNTVLLQPELAFHREMRWSGDHPQHGIVYAMTRSPSSPSSLDPVALVDADRDGTIDTCLSLDVATWQSQSWDEGYTALY